MRMRACAYGVRSLACACALARAWGVRRRACMPVLLLIILLHRKQNTPLLFYETQYSGVTHTRAHRQGELPTSNAGKYRVVQHDNLGPLIFPPKGEGHG